MKRYKKILTGLTAGLLSLSVLTGCGNSSHAKQTAHTNSAHTSLAQLGYRNNSRAYKDIHGNRSTLNPKSWHYDHVIYSHLDHENRTSRGNTGYLDKKNVTNDKLRTRQIVKPTGWHQKRIGRNGWIINRGHEIAYSLSKGINTKGQYKPGQKSGDQNNLRNLFTQSTFSNQQVQTIFESKVRHALEHNEKVVYQVKPVFQGKDLMAKGVHMQAISTNRKLNFNVYLFNVQPGIKFNYKNGTSRIDKNVKVKVPANAPFRNQNNDYRSNYRYGRRYHHHYMRDYAMYRVGKHMIRRHMRRHFYRTHYIPHHFHRHYY